jgi:hypothetical protein
MSVKVFQTNKAGKIEFTRCELEKLLNETYKEGYADGEAHAKKDYWTWISPAVTTNYPSISYSNSTRAIDDLTCGTTATNCISNENGKILAVAEPKDAIKVESTAVTNAPKTNAATVEAKGMTFNLDEVNKLASALFSSDLFGTINTNGAKKAAEETPFTKLAKELNF